MNSAIKKYSALILTLALSSAAGAGAVTASADRTDVREKIVQSAATPDVPEPVTSPFSELKDITKLPMLGDIDDDGNITSSDALIVLRAAVGLIDNHTYEVNETKKLSLSNKNSGI